MKFIIHYCAKLCFWRTNKIKKQNDKFIDFTRPKNQNKKEEKAWTYENVNNFCKRQRVLNSFESKIFPVKNKPAAQVLKYENPSKSFAQVKACARKNC